MDTPETKETRTISGQKNISGNDIGKWTVLESEYLIRRPWLTARRDKVRLPNGVINPEYYVLEYPDWINIIAITVDGRMVFERQYRHGRGEVGYEIPAGVCEPGETPEQAARRELLEETGFGGGSWRLNMVAAPNPSTSTNLCYSFIATGVHKIGDQRLEATEDITVHLLYEDEVLHLMREGKIIQAPMLCSLWKYFAEKTTL